MNVDEKMSAQQMLTVVSQNLSNDLKAPKPYSWKSYDKFYYSNLVPVW